MSAKDNTPLVLNKYAQIMVEVYSLQATVRSERGLFKSPEDAQLMAEVYSLQATVRSGRACLNPLKAKTSNMSPKPNSLLPLKIESC